MPPKHWATRFRPPTNMLAPGKGRGGTGVPPLSKEAISLFVIVSLGHGTILSLLPPTGTAGDDGSSGHQQAKRGWLRHRRGVDFEHHAVQAIRTFINPAEFRIQIPLVVVLCGVELPI